ncbi:MAG: hypothetical protein WC785_04840 [Tatlockia sp.]|jgi:hypothetical protein
MVALSEYESIKQILSEFDGITNEEAYANIFARRMMKPIPGTSGEFYGCNHRIDMLPFIQSLITNIPKGGEIFDVGAGAGDVVDFALKDAPMGTVVNIEEPNASLINSYIMKLKNYNNLHPGITYGGYLQDYYQETKNAILPKQPQSLILAMHMIYHLTDFTHQNIQPEKDIIDAFTFLYELLAPGGSIFIAYADLLDSETGIAVCGLAEKYFREYYPKGCYADNLISIYKARNKILGPKGLIKNHLTERFPGINISFRSERRMCHFFGKSKADIAVLALATELCSSDSDLFDLTKLQFCLNYILQYSSQIGLQKEMGNVPQKGLWRANEPHVIAIITKE